MISLPLTPGKGEIPYAKDEVDRIAKHLEMAKT
jgi:hypothetical protein